ncbi:MAG: major outer membrane protein [Planctomycetota bacterium]
MSDISTDGQCGAGWCAIVAALIVSVSGMALTTTDINAAETEEEKKPVVFSPDDSPLFSGDTWDSVMAAGTWKASTGMRFRADDCDEADNGDAGWSFIKASWESGTVHGMQIGLGGLFVTELWSNDAYDDMFKDGKFGERGKWTESYLRYTLPGETTSVLVGRAKGSKFGKPASGDGDFYEGLGVSFDGISNVSLKAHVTNAWLDNASESWDLDGIDKSWAEMDDVSGKVSHGRGSYGDFAYTLMADIDAVPDTLTLTPYLQTQSDVGTSYGISFDLSHPVSDSATLGLEGAYNYFHEDTPNKYYPDDDSFSQGLIRASAAVEDFELGAGYYGMSDDVLAFSSTKDSGLGAKLLIVDEMDPLEEGAGYGGTPGDNTYFLDAAYSYGPMSFNAMYGWVREARTANGNRDGDGRELDLTFGLDLTENLSLELFYANVVDDHSADGDNSQDVYAGGVTYKF